MVVPQTREAAVGMISGQTLDSLKIKPRWFPDGLNVGHESKQKNQG